MQIAREIFNRMDREAEDERRLAESNRVSDVLSPAFRLTFPEEDKPQQEIRKFKGKDPRKKKRKRKIAKASRKANRKAS